MTKLDPREEAQGERGEPEDEPKKIPLNPNLEGFTQIGAQLFKEEA